MKNGIDARNLVGGFLAGILIGTAVTLLAAPRSGKLTRNKIMRDSKKLRKQFYNSLNESLESMKGFLHNTGKELGNAAKANKGTKKSKIGSVSSRVGKVASRQDL